MDLGARLKAARAALGITQEDAVALSGIPLDTYRKYEGGKRAPGADAIAGLIRAGINANWLLTGDGPMLFADLVATAPPKINVDALEAIIEGTIKALPKASPDAIARQAVGFYVQCIEKELITPEGIGSSKLNVAA